MDPNNCSNCHSAIYKEWSGSMHAYASDDPIFLAMNKRGQRETGGTLGSFCVNCHAPLAVKAGTTMDGTNLATVPTGQRGVTCFYCHQIDAVNDVHDNALTLATDDVMRADIVDAQTNTAHRTLYSPLFDRELPEASKPCGSCHDVVNPAGTAVETTFAEWQKSVFAKGTAAEQLTCPSCHMPGSDGTAATIAGAPKRRVHDHTMAGVDLALTQFPQMQEQAGAVQAGLDSALSAKLCYKAGGTVSVSLGATFVGHDFPSGASHDRRAWLELIAYMGTQVVFSTGVVADGQDPLTINDPNLWMLRKKLFDAQNKPVSMLWQATRVEADELAVATSNDTPGVTKSLTIPANADRVTMRVRFQPIGLDVLKDLVASGDLDAKYATAVQTMDLGSTKLEYQPSNGPGCVP